MNAQLGDLAIAYGVTAAGMLAGLLLMRADCARLLALAGVFGHGHGARRGVVVSAAQAHAAAEWTVTHPRALYFCALGLYSVLGIALGLLLGRLTGRKTPSPTQENARE